MTGIRERWAVRTIKNGRVKIRGHEYEPRVPLPEHLNGTRTMFGLYWGPPSWDRYDEHGMGTFVFLWGTEKMARAENEDEYKRLWRENPFCVDGVFHWEWWHRVEES